MRKKKRIKSEIEKKYYKEAVDAVIKEDYIIPGISARKVLVNDSYIKNVQFGTKK